MITVCNRLRPKFMVRADVYFLFADSNGNNGVERFRLFCSRHLQLFCFEAPVFVVLLNQGNRRNPFPVHSIVLYCIVSSYHCIVLYLRIIVLYCIVSSYHCIVLYLRIIVLYCIVSSYHCIVLYCIFVSLYCIVSSYHCIVLYLRIIVLYCIFVSLYCILFYLRIIVLYCIFVHCIVF